MARSSSIRWPPLERQLRQIPAMKNGERRASPQPRRHARVALRAGACRARLNSIERLRVSGYPQIARPAGYQEDQPPGRSNMTSTMKATIRLALTSLTIASLSALALQTSVAPAGAD